MSVTTAMEAELQDFLMYYVQTPQQGRQRMKWRIVSSVTPSPLTNKNYKPEFLDPHELSTLKKYMKSLKRKSRKKGKEEEKESQKEVVMKKINCNKKVCEIADFLEMWTEFDGKKRRKDKPYNAVSHNCQQFALHLFKYLVGDNYADKVVAAAKQTQSPADIKAHKKESQQNAQSTLTQSAEAKESGAVKGQHSVQDDEKEQ